MSRLGPTGVASLVSTLKDWVISLLNNKANTSHTHGKADITDLPTIPTKVSDLTNDSGFLTTHNPVDSSLSSTSSNAVQNKVIYTELNNKANSSHTHTVSDVSDFPTLATVATSGSYNDLSNKPTIPTVNNATLTIQKNSTTVQTFTANASSNVTCNITVPTKTSELTNDSSFLTSHQAVTDSAPTLSWNTTSTIGSVGSTNLTVTMPANPNTDTKVTQTVTTSDNYYPLLACATTDNTSTETTTSRFSKGLEVRARYGMIRSYNCYNSSAILGSAPGSDLLAGGIYFGDYNKTTVSYALSYVYSSGRTALIFRVYNKLTNGAYATDGTSVNGYFRLNYDTSGKYIDTDMYWNSDLIPLSNNSKALGTSSLKWKEVYATNFYGALDGTATKATGNANGKELTNTIIKGLSVSGTTITYTKIDGNTGTITTQDTVYTHPTTAGNKHIPSGGSSGQYLKYSSSGTAVWANLPTIPTKTSELTNDSGFLTSHQSLANYLTKTTNVSEMGRYIDLHYDNATAAYDYDARIYVDSQGTAKGDGAFKIAAASVTVPNLTVTNNSSNGIKFGSYTVYVG